MDLCEYCAPEIAEKVLQLARSSGSLSSFLAACSLFVRAPAEVLTGFYSQHSTEREDSPKQSEISNTNFTSSSETTSLADESSDEADIDRQWYQDASEVPVPKEPRGYKQQSEANTKLHLYYTVNLPPFLTGLQKPLQLCQISKCPSGNLAQRAKKGSDIVREFVVSRERKRAVHSKVAAKGTLKALQDKHAGEPRNHAGDPPGRKRDATVSHAKRQTSSRNSTNGMSYLELQKTRKSLPSYQVKSTLLEIIRENQVTIIVGETGSGKTTQLPQFLYEEGYAKHGIIGCTQPRRMAAMSVSERVAAERGVVLGSQVGYAIRFESKLSEDTKIKFLTDGILLREALTDKTLEQYSCIIIDEAHERALNTDILLGLFKRILARRRDLKLIVTSATINAVRFSEFFGTAPIFNIPGRTHSVAIKNLKSPTGDYVESAVNQALSLHLQGAPGDILIFMTGQDDIEATCEHMQEKLESLDTSSPKLEILPVYSQLPADLQAKIFLPSEHRKVIVATNIAETSLTVEGVRYVIDSGYTKAKVYQPKYGVDTLQLVPISRANAAQRAGRAGRTSEGFAYRMYTKQAEIEEMYEQPIPEILRTNLANTILLLKSLGVHDISEFEFLDPPEPSNVQQSLRDLWFAGAIDSDGVISELGARLSQLPLDPFLAKMLMASVDNGCSAEMLTIVAMISAPPVFIRSRERAKECDRAHEKYQIPESDHLTLLNVYNEWRRNAESTKWCQENYLQSKTLRYAKSIRSQLERMIPADKLRTTKKGRATNREIDYDLIRKCVCMAYFHQASRAQGLQSFVGLTTGVEMSLHPTSALYGLGHIPEYVVYHEVILTSKQYMTVVTAIEPEWLLEYGSALYSSETPSSVASHETPKEVPGPASNNNPVPKFKRRKTVDPKQVNKSFMRGL